jgi:DNA-binding HxlR family transcriptional regulator
MVVNQRPQPAIINEEACRGFQAAIELVGRRWTGAILLAMSPGATRFGQILRLVDGLSDRLLSQRLKELTAEGLVTRTIVPTTPAHSLYALSDRGQELMDALQPLATWGIRHRGGQAG